jgi:hypothetical protein
MMPVVQVQVLPERRLPIARLQRHATTASPTGVQSNPQIRPVISLDPRISADFHRV